MKDSLELSESWEILGIASDTSIDPARLDLLEGQYAGRPAGWMQTSMPRQVQEALYENGVIDDPALPGKSADCLWVAEQDWLYRTRFRRPAAGTATYLYFHGLDTIVDIYLNGSLIGTHADMFLPYRVDVTVRIREENELVLRFHSPHVYLEHARLPPEWAGKVRLNKLLRKAHNDFTDYLGPKPYFTPIGVYGGIFVEVIDQIEIADVDISSRLAPGFDSAALTILVNGASAAIDAQLEVTLYDPDGTPVANARQPVGGAGEWSNEIDFTVQDPQLWWPRGHGEHPLYTVGVSVYSDGQTRDRVTRTIGLRDVTMLSPFEFVINGRPVKLWGAQTAPLRGISHRWDKERARRVLDLTERCNMNAQRIWGASDRYEDSYYDETDRRGILVWQEFFHDNGMYPESVEYRALCKREAEYQVRRLKHHPSIIMWCGGNEAIMGGEFDFPGEPFIGASIFFEDYAEVCARLDPDRFYHPNSPYGGAYANDPRGGDTHSYTNTWFVPGADYPIMIAEEIRVSPPAAKSLRRYFDSEADAWPSDYTGLITYGSPYPWPPTWTSRSSTEGWRKIPQIEQFYDADDLDSAVYKFGAAHALYLRRVLENNRRGRPWWEGGRRRHTQGHFVCRWNDSWPIIYGSMLDYFAEPFMPYYAIRRAYEPVLVSFDIGDFIHVWIVNDFSDDIEGILSVRLFDPANNRVVREMSRAVAIAAGESVVVADLNEFGQFSRGYVLAAELTSTVGQKVAESIDYVDIEKHLHFPDAQLRVEVQGDTLAISSDRFARCVELGGDDSGDQFGWIFEDNYFDLLPGVIKEVTVSGHSRGTVTAKAHYSKHTTRVAFGSSGDGAG